MEGNRGADNPLVLVAVKLVLHTVLWTGLGCVVFTEKALGWTSDLLAVLVREGKRIVLVEGIPEISELKALLTLWLLSLV